MIEIIEKISESIFRYDINSVNNDITVLTEKVLSIMPKLNKDELIKMNKILNYITTAMGNHDYLLMADFLDYELKPFILANQGEV